MLLMCRLQSTDEQYSRDILEMKHMVNSLQMKLTKAEFLQPAPIVEIPRVSWSDMPLPQSTSSSRYEAPTKQVADNFESNSYKFTSNVNNVSSTSNANYPGAGLSHIAASISNTISAPIFIPPPVLNIPNTYSSNSDASNISLATIKPQSGSTTPRQQYQNISNADYLLSPSNVSTFRSQDGEDVGNKSSKKTTAAEMPSEPEHLMDLNDSYTPMVDRSNPIRISNSSLKETVGIASRDFSQSESEVELASDSEFEEGELDQLDTASKRSSESKQKPSGRKAKLEKKPKGITSSTKKSTHASSSSTQKKARTPLPSRETKKAVTPSATPLAVRGKPELVSATPKTPTAVVVKTPVQNHQISTEKKVIQLTRSEERDFVPKVLMRKDAPPPMKPETPLVHEKVIAKKTMQVSTPCNIFLLL